MAIRKNLILAPSQSILERIENGFRCLSLKADCIQLSGCGGTRAGGDGAGILEPWEQRLVGVLVDCCKAELVVEGNGKSFALESDLLRVMAGDADCTLSNPPGKVAFLRYPIPEIERLELARKLRRQLADKVDPESLLVIHPNDAQYVRNLVRVLDDYELPHDGMLFCNLADLPLAEFVFKFVQLDRRSFTWRDWLWLAGSPYITREGKGLSDDMGFGPA